MNQPEKSSQAVVVDPLAASREFMVKDLKKSGLSVSDFPIPPVPLRPQDGVSVYRIYYTTDWYKDRFDRVENKYINCPKSPPVASFGDFKEAKVTAAVEAYKKALAFYIATGIPTVVLDSCHGWGEKLVDVEQISLVRELHNEISGLLPRNAAHIVLMDGDWQSNENVGNALATYITLLEERGIRATALDLGVDSVGNRMGFDDWAVSKFGTSRAFWPEQKEVVKHVFSLPKIAHTELEVSKTHAMSTVERLGTSLVDLTHRGTASLVIKLVGKDNLRYLIDCDTWIRWDVETSQWRDIGKEPLALVDVATKYFMEVVSTYFEQSLSGSDDAKAKAKARAKATMQWAQTQCSSTPGRRNILGDLKQRPYLQARLDHFDSNPNLLGALNGVVDLRTGEFRRDTQDDLILKRCPIPYPDAEPSGPAVSRIKQLLIEITSTSHGQPAPNRLKWLQRRLGASLRGVCALSALEIWHGPGANGKSVLAKLLQRTLGWSKVGGYAASVPAEVILSSFKARDPEAATPFLMTLSGARMVFISETADTAHLNEAFLKQLTGDDSLVGRGNYKDAASIDLSFSIFLLTNNLPHMAEGGAAVWDRIAPMEFKCRWQRPDKIMAEDYERNLPLGDRWFLDEAPNQPEVLQYLLWWLVQGSIEWGQHGIGEAPADTVESLMRYKEEQDHFSRWVEDERWLLDTGGCPDLKPRTRSAEVYQSYRDWCERNGRKAPQSSVFSKRLLDRFKPHIQSVKSDGKNMISGLYKQPITNLVG